MLYFGIIITIIIIIIITIHIIIVVIVIPLVGWFGPVEVTRLGALY